MILISTRGHDTSGKTCSQNSPTTPLDFQAQPPYLYQAPELDRNQGGCQDDEQP